jgi:tRNA (mo5U34)-methyltransferase
MTEAELRSELERLAPFHHEIDLPFGLRTQGDRDLDHIRLRNLRERLWPRLSLDGQRVLDVACNCGGFSFEAAKSGASYVLGIDIVDHYLEQADFLKRVLGHDQIEFRKLAVEDVDQSLGRFDVTFCFGILYHLENPVLALKALAALTDDIMVVDTRLDPTNPERTSWLMNFAEPTGNDEDRATALWRRGTCQFLPSARAVTRLLQYVGFPTVTRVPAGDGWGTFYARR